MVSLVPLGAFDVGVVVVVLVLLLLLVRAIDVVGCVVVVRGAAVVVPKTITGC